MDSRPHDDFIQPERSIVDEASPSPETTFTGEQALSPAPSEAHGTDHLLDAIDDLELELASMLTPDLEAIDLDGSPSDTPAPEVLETLVRYTDSEPVAAISGAAPDMSDQPTADAIAASEPETTDAPSAGDALAVDGGALLDADELELTLDDLAVDFLAAAPEAMTKGIPVSVETAVVLSETVVVSEGLAVGEPEHVDPAASDERATAGLDVPSAVEASAAESSGQPLVVEASDIPAETAVTPVEVVRAEAVASEIAPAEAIAIPQPEPAMGTENAESRADIPVAPMTFEQALDAQDIPATGFEAAVRGAADRSNSRFLFQMPVHTVADCQRVAAVNLPGDESPKTVLVLLRADGRSYRMEDARESENPFAGMAVSYGGLLAHLKSLPVRAAA